MIGSKDMNYDYSIWFNGIMIWKKKITRYAQSCSSWELIWWYDVDDFPIVICFSGSNFSRTWDRSRESSESSMSLSYFYSNWLNGDDLFDVFIVKNYWSIQTKTSLLSRSATEGSQTLDESRWSALFHYSGQGIHHRIQTKSWRDLVLRKIMEDDTIPSKEW